MDCLRSVTAHQSFLTVVHIVEMSHGSLRKCTSLYMYGICLLDMDVCHKLYSNSLFFSIVLTVTLYRKVDDDSFHLDNNDGLATSEWILVLESCRNMWILVDCVVWPCHRNWNHSTGPCLYKFLIYCVNSNLGFFISQNCHIKSVASNVNSVILKSKLTSELRLVYELKFQLFTTFCWTVDLFPCISKSDLFIYFECHRNVCFVKDSKSLKIALY